MTSTIGEIAPNVRAWIVEQRQREAIPTLEACVRNHDLEGVRAALATGVRIPRDLGTTALRWAAHYGDADAVLALLDAGADPRAERSIALRWAVAMKRDWVAILLLAAGARITDVDRSAVTPERYADLASAPQPMASPSI